MRTSHEGTVVPIPRDGVAGGGEPPAATDVQARLAAVVCSSTDAIITVSGDGRITSWNAAAERIYGYPAEEALGQPRELVLGHPDEQAVQDTAAASALSGDTFGPFEARRRRKDGAEIDISATASPVRDEHGNVIEVAGIIRDITERKRIERELERSRRCLEQAELVGRCGSWEWEVATDAVAWSAGLYALTGLDPATTATDRETGLATRVHPGDRERVRELLDRVVADLTPVETEYRFVRRDGRVRVFRLRAEAMVDETGRATRVVGAVRDLTDERHAQTLLADTAAQLSACEEELQHLAISPAPTPEPLSLLTPRQLEILKLVARGLTTPKIAQELFLSEPTVKWHVKQILAKTGAANRTDAVVRVFGGAGRVS